MVSSSLPGSSEPSAFPQPEDYLPGLYSPIVVWDTTRRSIVQHMTDREKETFARHSADQLQALMPQVDQAFREYPNIRPRYAREFLCRKIEGYGALIGAPTTSVREDSWTYMNERLDAIGTTISQYQRLLGYWSNALLSLLPRNAACREALAAQRDLETLFHCQDSIYTGLQLEECLRLLHKAPQTDAVGEWVETLSKRLDACASSLLEALRAVDQRINNVDVDTYLEAHQVVLVRPDDNRLNTLTRFLLIRQCFETINRQASGVLLATLHDFCEVHYPDGRLFDLAVKEPHRSLHTPTVNSVRVRAPTLTHARPPLAPPPVAVAR